jgi:hypothetical protein
MSINAIRHVNRPKNIIFLGSAITDENVKEIHESIHKHIYLYIDSIDASLNSYSIISTIKSRPDVRYTCIALRAHYNAFDLFQHCTERLTVKPDLPYNMGINFITFLIHPVLPKVIDNYSTFLDLLSVVETQKSKINITDSFIAQRNNMTISHYQNLYNRAYNKEFVMTRYTAKSLGFFDDYVIMTI